MKRLISAAIVASVFLSYPAFTKEKPVAVGINIFAGGRYDNVRFCASTGGGYMGGPIMDIMLNTRFNIVDNFSIVLNLPLMRPILFASAFSMLQFEPQITFEVRTKVSESLFLVAGPGFGASLNYGPDWQSRINNRSMPFFSAGPILSALLGLGFNAGDFYMVTGLRFFATPLFMQQYAGSGVTAGVAIDATIYF